MSMKKHFAKALVATAALCGAVGASAAVITLDFEGVGSGAAVLNFYNGGTDSQGNSGINYGVAFNNNALALRESDPTANFALAPSPETAMFFLTGSAILNYAPGFTGGFSFWYTTVAFTGSVRIFDGLNASGNLLGVINLAALGTGPSPGNPFSNWAIGSLALTTTARSVDFGGTVNAVGYDNITFGSTNPTPQPVSLPGSLALVGLGLAALAASTRRRRA